MPVVAAVLLLPLLTSGGPSAGTPFPGLRPPDRVAAPAIEVVSRPESASLRPAGITLRPAGLARRSADPVLRGADLVLRPVFRADAAAVRYWWPLAKPLVVRRFDPPAQPWLAGHRGVDLAGSAGAVVRTAGAGTVVYAQTLAGRGVVSIAHAGGLRTTYEPVTAMVRAGDRLAVGDPIGTVSAGHPGCSEAACLHWGLRRGAVYLDPLALLGLSRVRLLPLATDSVTASAAVHHLPVVASPRHR